jgi:Uma2 family endonuclease
MKAGVWEYWILAPKSQTVQSFVPENGASTGTVYDSGAVLPSAVFKGLSITLHDVFAG